VSPLLLRTTARAAARHAAMTGTAAHHKHAAPIACRGISELNECTQDFYAGSVRGGQCFTGGARCEQLSLLAFEEFEFQPAKQIIHLMLGST
jgi:hypothetical protein